MRRVIGLFIFTTLVTPAGAANTTSSATILVGPSGASCNKLDQNFTPGGDAQARCIANVPGGFFDFFASANASFGRLGVLASGDVGRDMGDTAPSIFGSADGFASFSDSLTISAGSTAVFGFDVHGGPAGGNFVGAAQIEDIHGQFELVVAPGKKVTFTEGFTPGSPLAIRFSLDTKVTLGVGPGCGTDPFAPPCMANELSDFSDTAILKSIQVLDDNGNLLSGVTIASESGFDYSRLGSPVPESPTALLIALGALLPALKRIRGTRWRPLVKRRVIKPQISLNQRCKSLSQESTRASRLTASWMQASVMKAARLSAGFL